MSETQYIIRGGTAGRERLRLLSRVMRSTTLDLLQRVGLRPEMRCLDCGCGGGDVSFELAAIVGPDGQVTGVDIDDVKLDLARREAADRGLRNVEFLRASVVDDPLPGGFDVVYARFLLAHLRGPERIVERMLSALRPGGLIVLEDIDFRGHFSDPPCPALVRYVELFTRALERRGADANVGPRLPGLLRNAGCERIQMHVVHPADLNGDAKLLNPVSMEAIGEVLAADGLADRAEIDQLVEELYAFARDPHTILVGPRVVQGWGVRPA